MILFITKKRKQKRNRVKATNRLKNIREYRGFSQEAVAKKIGVSSGSISHMESGRNAIKKKYIPIICELLECQEGELLGFVPFDPLNKENSQKEKNREIREEYVKISIQIIDNITDSDYLTKSERLAMLESVYNMVHDFYESENSPRELYQKIIEYERDIEIKKSFITYAKDKLISNKNDKK